MRPAFSLGIILLLTFSPLAQAATVDELQSKIDQRNQQIKALEQEIAQYQTSLDATAKQSSTLSGELNILNTGIKKLNADIKITENKIANSQETIQELQLQIGDKDSAIQAGRQSLEESLRLLRQNDSTTLLEQVAGEKSLSDFWADSERLTNLENKVNEQISNLRVLRTDLTDKKARTEAEKEKLMALSSQLADQKKIAAGNYQAKDTLLKQTKNQEASYKKLLADRQAQKQAFEQELFQFESQLRLQIDKSKLPTGGHGLLSWPLDNVYITQYFGKTIDAARLYVSGTHNGIDLRASLGTPVKATLGGTVTATGNTDLQPGCYSYGKWVLIDHQNGLSTLYGHLSLIKAVAGQAVATGQLIGYSGSTGYATGPHLHLTVYATQGVRVTRYTSSLHCQNVDIPIADPKAYLDPMVYL